MNKAFILPRRRKALRPYLDLTAMIDTVFNLLIFFAVISTFSAGGKHGISMDLPKAKTASPILDRVVLAVLPGRSPQINGREVTVAEIGPALEEVTRGEHETQVVVMADKRVQYDHSDRRPGSGPRGRLPSPRAGHRPPIRIAAKEVGEHDPPGTQSTTCSPCRSRPVCG